MTTPDSFHPAALTQAMRALDCLRSTSEVVDGALQFALSLARARRACSLLSSDAAPAIRLRAVPELDPQTLPQIQALIEPLARQVVQTGHGQIVPQSAGDSGPESPAGSALVVPLQAGPKTIGALYLERDSHVERFTPQDQSLLELWGAYAGLAIQGAREREAIRTADAEFISVLSHELRVPMTFIKGYSDLLLRGAATSREEELKFLAIIRNNVTRLNVLLNDFGDIARLEALRLTLSLGPIDLAACLEDVLAPPQPVGAPEHAMMSAGVAAESLTGLQSRIEAKGQTITADLPALPPLYADRPRLHQILTTLITNAHYYTPAGGHIAVTAEAQVSSVRVAVTDTGIGISPEDQARVFDKFFRASNPAVREQPGWGLSLHIAKRLVEVMGGQIGLRSEPNKGSTFWFTLPTWSGTQSHAV